MNKHECSSRENREQRLGAKDTAAGRGEEEIFRHKESRWSREMEREDSPTKTRALNLKLATNPRSFVFASEQRKFECLRLDCGFHWISLRVYKRVYVFSRVYVYI